MIANPVILATPAKKAQAAGAVRMEGGQPSRRFVKELVRAGRYVKDVDGQIFNITPGMIDQLALSTTAYLAAGNKIPMPATPDHSDQDPEANRGWVREVYRDGNSLFGVCDLVGDDGIKLAGTCDVSIFSPPEFIDGTGNRYQWPILHVALCTNPIVPGLDGFVPIKTSQSTTNQNTPAKWPVFRFSQEQKTMPPVDPVNPMPAAQATPATDESVESDPFDAALDAIEKQFLPQLRAKDMDPKERKKLAQEFAKKVDSLIKVLGDESDEEPEGDGEGEPVEACTGVRMSRGSTVHPTMVKMAAEIYSLKLDGLVRARKITPAVAAKLKAQFIGTGQPLALSLSRSTNGATELDGVILALAENAVVPAEGERTGPQGAFVLSNPLKDKEEDAETKKAMEFMHSRLPVKAAK